jgi:methylmalonyl-CoA/ethylmalonyl-CoA epimerase
MSRRIDHIGIAVQELDERLPFWTDCLGLRLAGIETVASEGVRVAFLEAGSSRIELLEPIAPDSPVGRHLERRGEGVHHVTLEVPDLGAALERLGARGVEPIGPAPRPGAGGSRVAFLHPRSTGGVLVELVERAESGSGAGGAPIGPGAVVLAYLREPQEKMWGVLRRLDASGVVAETIELSSFDEWVTAVAAGEESVLGPSVLFLPMARVEKLLLDRPSGALPSLSERFERRVGRTVHRVLAELARAAER